MGSRSVFVIRKKAGKFMPVLYPNKPYFLTITGQNSPFLYPMPTMPAAWMLTYENRVTIPWGMFTLFLGMHRLVRRHFSLFCVSQKASRTVPWLSYTLQES